MKLSHEIAILVVVFGAGAVVGSMDFADALTTEAIEKEARVERASALEREPEPIRLTHPLPCERWIAQWGPGELPKPRCVKWPVMEENEETKQ